MIRASARSSSGRFTVSSAFASRARLARSERRASRRSSTPAPLARAPWPVTAGAGGPSGERAPPLNERRARAMRGRVRAVVQRVSRAEVRVEGRATGRIGRGLAVLLGVARDDGEEDARLLA